MLAGTLEIQMLANMAQLAEDMRKAKSTVGGAMQNIESTVASAKRALGALGVGVGFGALVAGFKSVIDSAAKLDDMAEKTGAAVAELSKLEQVARIGGHSIEIAETALIKLSKALHGADEESKGAGKALGALGLNADALRNKDTAEALRIVAGELNKYADGSGKTALALDLLGKSGAQALPFLKDLATEGGINARVTAEQAAEAEEFQKALKRLGVEIHGVSQALALGAVPAMNDWIVANREAIRVAGSAGEAMRLFVFNLDAMTSEKPRQEIERLTEALRPYQQAGSVGKFMLSPTGFLFGGREEDLKKQIEFLKFLERQQALEGRTGPQFLDARDLMLLQKPLLDYTAGIGKTGTARRELADRTMADLARSLQMQEDILDEARRLGVEFTLKQQTARDRQKTQLEQLSEHYRDLVDLMRKYERELEKIAELERAGILGGGLLAGEAAAARTDVYRRMAEAAKALADDNKKAAGEISEFWKEAARSMQQSMSSFFFDIMQGNLRNLGSNFKRTIDQMVANILAAKAQTALFGPGFGQEGVPIRGLVGDVLDWLTGSNLHTPWLGAPEFAGGGEFSVGGMGGTDSQLVAFRATPGERVRVETPEQQRPDWAFQQRTELHYTRVERALSSLSATTGVPRGAGGFRASSGQVLDDLLRALASRSGSI